MDYQGYDLAASIDMSIGSEDDHEGEYISSFFMYGSLTTDALSGYVVFCQPD
jgi:hypothetical protein